MNNEHSHGSEARKLSRIEHLTKRRRTGKGFLGIAQSQRPPATPWTGANSKQDPSINLRRFRAQPDLLLRSQNHSALYLRQLIKKTACRSAPINRVSRFDGRHKQRPYSLGRIIMSLIHKRGLPLLNPKLTRHLGRAPRPNRIEHANTLAYRICKRPSGFYEEHCRIADDATKPQVTRASAAALQPNQAILAWSARCISHKYV